MWKKLGLKVGGSVAFDQAPEAWTLPDLPDGTTRADDDGPSDVILSFFRAAADLDQRLPVLSERIFPAGSLWIAWPRRAGGHESDLTDHLIRDRILALGLVDTKVAAIDSDWSGLKVVWRRERRDGPPPT